MIENMNGKKTKDISYIILNLISLIFPALLVTSILGSKSEVNSFEIGVWTTKFILINLMILVFGIIYYRKVLPKTIIKYFRTIQNFEVSRNTALIVLSALIGIYIIFTIPELFQPEIDVWKDWQILGPIIEEFPFGGEKNPSLKILYVNNFLLYVSQEVFQNVKLIPFFGSLSLVVLTYFITFQISNNRFAGLIAVGILLQSHTFLRYDTTATYSNFWTVFYLLSLYLIYKKWAFSPLAYIAAIFSKALNIAFLPFSLFFIFKSHVAKKTKMILTVSYIIIIFIILFTIVFTDKIGYGKVLTSFDFADFVSGLTALSFQLRIDGLVLLFLLPLTIGLFIKSRKGFKEADSILVLIAGILLSAPLLVGFSEFNIQPYRWIPLIVFFAIGVGVLLSKKSTNRSVE